MGLVPRLVVLTAVSLLLAAADAPPAPTPTAASPDVVAKRGSVQLTTADIDSALNLIDPVARAQILASPPTLLNFVKERVVRQILLTQARDAKWDENPDVIAKANEARDTAIVQLWLTSQAPLDPAYPNDAELRAAYQANQARFAVPAQYRLQQIAILIPAGASKQAEEAARRKAQDARAQVTKPKADFAAIAKAVSQDPTSASKGGDLGWVREDQLLKPVRDMLPGMALNAISEPIRAADSWHVVKLLEVRPASTLPLDQVKANLIAAMRQAKAQQETASYIQGLLKTEPVTLDDHDLAARITAAK